MHDLLLSKGIQAGDGPIKQAIMRHKTRLHAEFTKLKIKRGVKFTEELVQGGDRRAGVCFLILYVLATLIFHRSYPALRTSEYPTVVDGRSHHIFSKAGLR